MLFSRQIEYIESFEDTLFSTFKATLAQFDFVVVDFIVNKQLFRLGQDSEGKRLKGYTRQTIRLKISKGDPADRTTLRDEGTFYAQMGIDTFDDRFEIFSTVDHTKYLIKRYGENAMRPSPENMKEFLKVYLVPKLKSEFND